MEDMLYNAAVGSDSSSTQSSAAGSADTAVDNTVVVSSSHNAETSAIPLSKKMKLIQKHTTSSQSNPDARLRDEIKTYLRHEPEEQDDDPLSFWKKGKFPLLQDLAKEVLTQSASSVQVENMFSTMGLVLNGKRSSLAPHRANWLSFIHDNFAYYYKTKGDDSVSTN